MKIWLFKTFWRTRLKKSGIVKIHKVHGWKTALVTDKRAGFYTAEFLLPWWPLDWKELAWPYTIRRKVKDWIRCKIHW